MGGLPDRVLSFAGVHNFRDYGDYATAGGGRVKAGLLYRSAQHRDATPDDLAKIGGLGLAAVIDLRGGSERRGAPCPRPEGFAARVISAEEETAGLAPHIEAAKDVSNPAEARAAMQAGYRVMGFRPILAQLMKQYFEALATTDGPTLIHCMAGKDRTGLAVALLHSLLGVHRDDMIADYLLTNQAGNVEERIAAGAVHVRQNYGAHLGDEAVRVLMTTDASYLEAALAGIAERHGSVEAYLRDVLDVDAARRAAIEARLVG